MLTGEAPGGFAVPREIDDGQRFTHDLLLRRCPARSEAFNPLPLRDGIGRETLQPIL
jgi:hypothetical protein